MADLDQHVDTSVTKDWMPTEAGYVVDMDNHFAVQLPNDWETHQFPKGPTKLLSFSPQESVFDVLQEGVVINTASISPRWDSEDHLRASLGNAIGGDDGSYDEIDRGTTTVSGLDAHWILYDCTSEGLQGRQKAYAIATRGRGYLIVFTALPETMDDWEEPFDEVLESVVIPE